MYTVYVYFILSNNSFNIKFERPICINIELYKLLNHIKHSFVTGNSSLYIFLSAFTVYI